MIYVYHLMANKENQKFIQSQSKNQHKSNVTYHAECTCGKTYNEETKRNFAVRKANMRTSLTTLNWPVTSPNTQPAHIHCMHRENYFSEDSHGRPANCLRETNPKQTSTFFHCETVPLGNDLTKRNQVVCKFPSCTTDDDRTVENIMVFKILVIFSLL